jgi:hypothetical protein
MGVRRSTRAKCEDINIDFESRQAPVYLTYALVIYFESFTLCLFDCALSL